MTILLASLLAVVTIANVIACPVILYIALSDRSRTDESREREQAAHGAQLDGLLNRIQAPEVAVAQSIDVEDPGPGYIPVTDDAAMNAHTSDVLAQLEQLQYGG